MRLLGLVAASLMALAITPAVAQTTYPPPSTEGSQGSFRVECEFSHGDRDDPIVFPGQPGASHLHDFFGNTSTAANSTYVTMQAGTSTCTHSGDRAGYWAPSLIAPDGRVVQPDRAIFYYRNRPIDYGTTVPYPENFKLVAGGTGWYPATYWTCEGESDGSYSTSKWYMPNCGSARIKMHVYFPSCWDGVSLDSTNHRRHVVYGRTEDNRWETRFPDLCPAHHPVKIPQLDFRVLYPVTDGRGYRFSSGETLPHADFWNTWDQTLLESLVETCLNVPRSCGQVSD